MHISEKVIDNLVRETVEDSSYLEVHSVTKCDDTRYHAEISFNGRKSDASAILYEEDPRLTIDETTSYVEQDNGAIDKVIRIGTFFLHPDNEDQDFAETNLFEDMDFSRAVVILVGTLSCGEFYDKGCDTYFDGTLFLQFDDEDWAIEQSSEIAHKELVRGASSLMNQLTKNLKRMRELGIKQPVDSKDIANLVRTAMVA